MKLVLIALSIVVLLVSGGDCYAQAMPPDCDRHSNKLECIIYFGTQSKSQSGSGITGTAGTTAQDNIRRYVIFIYLGRNALLTTQAARALAERGYIVKQVDDQNVVSGPGVDFFREEDRQGAEAVASLVNDLLKKQLPRDTQTLRARLQTGVSNPPGFISVWLPDSGPIVKGWYYLGKISRNKAEWLPSSAKDSLTFEPKLEANKDIVSQLKAATYIVTSNGYKYLRSEDSVSGKRVQAKVTTTLAPNVKAKIVGVDDGGADPDDGQTVLWALVEVIRTRSTNDQMQGTTD